MKFYKWDNCHLIVLHKEKAIHGNGALTRGLKWSVLWFASTLLVVKSHLARLFLLAFSLRMGFKSPITLMQS